MEVNSKKIYYCLMAVFGFLLAIDLLFGEGILFLIVAPLFLVVVLMFYRSRKKYDFIENRDKNKLVIVPTKFGNDFILSPEEKIFFYKNEKVNIDDVISIELLNNSKVIAKSNLLESIVGGVLFGGEGAIAGALAGKKDTYKDKYAVVIKTSDIYHSSIYVEASFGNCTRISETIHLIKFTKEN